MHGFSTEIISETLQTTIKTLVQYFEQKNIFSDISLPRLGKNMSTALQNMNEFKRNKKQYSKHSKKCSVRLEKYNNS